MILVQNCSRPLISRDNVVAHSTEFVFLECLNCDLRILQVGRLHLASLQGVEEKTITSNHLAFFLGYLSLYPEKTMALLGQPLGRTQLPDSYERLFSKDACCVDDANQSIYPSKGELNAFFEAS